MAGWVGLGLVAVPARPRVGTHAPRPVAIAPWLLECVPAGAWQHLAILAVLEAATTEQLLHCAGGGRARRGSGGGVERGSEAGSSYRKRGVRRGATA